MAPTDTAQASATEGIPPSRRSDELVAGRYRLLGRLGAGGMGEVYEAEHLELGRRFAVKFLRRELCRDRGTIERFRREVRAMAALSSEHIVSVVDCGLHLDGAPFLVMERLHGEDLRQMLARDGRLAIGRAVNLVLDACRGLRVVHDAGLIHRDLKPANLFVTRRDTGEDLCKILDFGVAKSVGADTTNRGSLVGTVRYMAPEQLRDGAAVDPRTDLYALGAILYECLGGAPPFGGETLEEVMFKIMNERLRPLGEFCQGIPAALDAVVLQALSREPRERFSGASELAAALLPVVSARPSTVSVPTAPDVTTINFASRRPSNPYPRRTRLWVGLSGAALAAIIALGALGDNQRPSEPTPAQPRLQVAAVSAALAPLRSISAISAPLREVPASSASRAAETRDPAPTIHAARANAKSAPSRSVYSLVPIDTRNPYGK